MSSIHYQISSLPSLRSYAADVFHRTTAAEYHQTGPNFSPDLLFFFFFRELQDLYGSEGPGGPTTFPKGTEVYYFI